MRRARHGLAWGWLLIMVITLSLFAVTYAVMDTPVQELFDSGDQHSNSTEADEGQQMAEAAWTWAPLGVLASAALALLARAIWEAAQPGS